MIKGYLYLTKLTLNEHTYIKVGVTENLDMRMSILRKAGFDVQLLQSTYGQFKAMKRMEQFMLYQYDEFRVAPIIRFAGHTECFSPDVLPNMFKCTVVDV